MNDVVGLDLGDSPPDIHDAGTIVIRARNPRSFFREFGRLVIEEGIEVRRLEMLDASAQKILGYLLGGKR
jgi:hypothetical protein